MQEGNTGFESGGVGDEGHVHGFLNGVRREQGEAGGAAEHYVRVVTEDGERMGCYGSGADMKCSRREFACDFIHVGDHEQQTLRGGEGRRQGARLERAMHRSCGAAFALHFDDVGDAAPDIGHAFR